MSNKPVDLTSAGDKNDRQAVWEVIRALGKNGTKFTLKDIGKKMQWAAQDNRLFTYLRCLEKGGYLEVVKKPYQENIYTLLIDKGIDAPRLKYDGTKVTQGIGREQMWRTMRILKTFSAKDLSVSASSDDHTVKLAEAKDYCHHLRKAGYLKGGPKEGYVFLVSRYTGPRPPKIQRTKSVFDPNLGKVVWPEAHHE